MRNLHTLEDTPYFIPHYIDAEMARSVPDREWKDHGNSGRQTQRIPLERIRELLPPYVGEITSTFLNRYTGTYRLEYHNDGMHHGPIRCIIALDGIGPICFREGSFYPQYLPSDEEKEPWEFMLHPGDAIFWTERCERRWEHGGEPGKRTSLVARFSLLDHDYSRGDR